CGIVVNNGIVLLDCIHRLRREEGLGRADAILEGTRRRMRPIIMTAVTTIVGLLPMALFGDSSGQGPSYVGMSIAVVGGLTVSTIFTAFVVPLMYTVMDDLSAWFQRVWEMALSGRARRHTV
ncbi:MAG: efflux RND transporter permease subunit, partial [Planctomycetota bacterium]|nr:efflux RND transporter permease subunit [Planctomycetota bacterium]